MDSRTPIRIAHRGTHDVFPENSLPAILRSLDSGAQGVEIDVHSTADGTLVVHHDPDLADGRRIREVPASVIRAAQLAPGIPIPTLGEALEAVAGRAILFIETKAEGVEFALLRAVRGSGAEAAVHSFFHDTMRNLKSTMPALRTGILTSGPSGDAVAALHKTGADDLWHQTGDITASVVSDCHRLGKQVIAWTANSQAECTRLADLGVDGICTDDLSLLSAHPR